MASRDEVALDLTPPQEPVGAASRLQRWLTRPWAPPAFAALLAAVIAGRGISALPLRFDEFFSLTAVVTDPRISITHEGPLVPYYTVLWLWTLGGELTSDTWLRVLSLVAVIATAVVTALIAKRLAGVLVAYAAAGLFALNPGVHFVAQDARPYALGMLLFTAAAFVLLRAVEGSQRGDWVGFSVLVLLGTVMMPNGLIIFAPLTLLYSQIRPRFFVAKRFLLALVPTVLLLIVGIVAFSSAIATMRASLPSPAVSWIPTGVIWTGIAEAESYGAPGTFAAVLLVLAGLTAPGRRVLWGVLGSVLLVWVISQGPSSQWMGRTFITFIPLVTIAAAFAVARMKRTEIIAVMVVTVLLAGPGYTAVRLWDAPADLRLATEVIEREADATDQIFGDGYLGEGRSFELAAGVKHYAATEPPWEVTTEPTREFWLLYPDYPCEELFSEDVRGGMNLRRCAAPS